MAGHSTSIENLRRQLHVAVAGAGPVGLASSLFLCQSGIKVTLFERATAEKLFKDTGSVFDLSPASCYVLEKIGLYQELSTSIPPYTKCHFATSEGKTVRRGKFKLEMKNELGSYSTFPMSRSLIQGTLLRKLKPYDDEGLFQLECSSEVVGFQDPMHSSDKETFEKVLVAVKQGSKVCEEAFDALMGCDGVHSKVRKALSNHFGLSENQDELNDCGVTAWWAKFDFQEALSSEDDNSRQLAQDLKKLGLGSGTTFVTAATPKLPIGFFATTVPESIENMESRKLAWCCFIKEKHLKEAQKEIGVDDSQDLDLTKRGGISGKEAKQSALDFFFKTNGNPKAKNTEKNLVYRLIQETKPEEVVRCGLYDRKNSQGSICFGQSLSLRRRSTSTDTVFRTRVEHGVDRCLLRNVTSLFSSETISKKSNC